MKVIAITNVKGGVCKSTLSNSLAFGLCLKGYRVLLIDSDPQTNLTLSILEEQPDDTPSLYHIYSEGKSIDEVKIPIREGLDLIIGDFNLSNSDMMYQKAGRLNMLKRALKNMKSEYDFVIVDCCPHMGVLTLNALMASTHILVPMLVDSFSLKGARILKEILDDVESELEKVIPVVGIVITRYDKRTITSRLLEKSVNDAASLLGSKVLRNRIRQAVVVNQCQIVKESIFEYAPKEKVTDDYRALIDEILFEMEEEDHGET
ncbi:MAG: ParA family protein [Lachnospiraceae bacterium]|nr:ParA family protein [Lachnospiraceae bacterium]